MKIRTVLIALGAGVALAVGTAAPAFADHDAGIQDTTQCEYGSMLAGGPSETLYTTKFTALRVAGSLTVVCKFTTPTFVPACTIDGCSDFKGDWTAPTRPKTYSVRECYAPGTDLAGMTQPNGESARPAERGSIVFYKTTAVLTCFWKNDPTDEPGYWDVPAY